nr:squamosa promoter-binding-like protein 15 [Lilium brownii var. viridulum]
MERDAGAQVASPAFFLHPGRFHDSTLSGKKREPPWQNPSFRRPTPQISSPVIPTPSRNWNPDQWDWDSRGFAAKPAKLDGENLSLKPGGGAFASVEEPVLVPVPVAAARPNKRVRSGSPGSGGGYPMCQVDDCRADLSGAEDYHRRHKVCEGHSKMTNALVGKVMQRFCQQCSRFHPLSEFDEGKRSCRRRLAGHNRRRRKSQHDDVSSRLAAPGNQENVSNGNLDVTNLLALLARLQGKNVEKLATIPDKDHLIQILSKIHPLPSANSSSRSPVSSGIDLNVSQASQQVYSEQPSKTNGSPTAPSTMDLLGVLSTALVTTRPNTSPTNDGSNGGSKSMFTTTKAASDVSSHIQPPSLGVGGSSCINQTTSEERLAQEAHVRLQLQLFGSVEDDSPPKFGSSVKYLSSESSNPMEDRSPPSSPPVPQELFPVHPVTERRHERMSICREDNQAAEASTNCRWSTRMEVFKDPERQPGNNIVLTNRSQAGYASSSGSDHSPSSSTSDAQDRTGRIIFKLFGKDPSNLPESLRSQILNWLSSSPSEMESYIRPGCVVLSVYVAMSSISWDELEENLLQRVNSLVQGTDSNFWRSGRFLACTSKQLVSHKDGKIRMCKSWRTWSAPELTSVSPVAVVSGKETSIILRGRNLTVPGTKIHCTYMGGYTSKEVLCSTYPGTIYDDSSTEVFNFPGGPPNMFGRCFIEVENGFKGNSFPIIIANATICQELRVLESEFEDLGTADVNSENRVQQNEQPRSKEDVLHFLNELSWLFQKKGTPSSLITMDFSNARFKFLITFSVERDWSALVKLILDILVERSIRSDVLAQEALEMLSEVQLLSRAVKRKCRQMVDMLLHYSVRRGPDTSKLYLFPPNVSGPGGLTPLHLAASTQESADMVDVLTNDPQEVGLQCWDSVKDNNGHTPYMYASMRNNNAYNTLVDRKLIDVQSGQISIDVSLKPGTGDESDKRPLQAGLCVRCAVMDTRRGRRVVRTQGFLQRPYVHSLLAIAAVCVCVCLFLRGMPRVGCGSPFKWENLDFGPS